jgi:hypothetical protein
MARTCDSGGSSTLVGGVGEGSTVVGRVSVVL